MFTTKTHVIELAESGPTSTPVVTCFQFDKKQLQLNPSASIMMKQVGIMRKWICIDGLIEAGKNFNDQNITIGVNQGEYVRISMYPYALGSNSLDLVGAVASLTSTLLSAFAQVAELRIFCAQDESAPNNIWLGFAIRTPKSI